VEVDWGSVLVGVGGGLRLGGGRRLKRTRDTAVDVADDAADEEEGGVREEQGDGVVMECPPPS
jgi:hypothetical protein